LQPLLVENNNGDELDDKCRLEVCGYSGDAGDSLQYEGNYDGNNNGGRLGMEFTK